MKRNFFFLFCLALLACVCSLSAEWRYAYTDESLVLDGLLTETAWQAAPWQDDFTTMGPTAAAPQEETRCKVLVTQKGLWIGVECQDSFIDSVPRKKDQTTWLDDCIEIFISPHALINPDTNLQDYYQFILTPSTSVFDGYSIGGALNDKWNCHFQCQAATIPNGWGVEFFLPFSALMPCDFNTWHMMIARENVMPDGKAKDIVSLPHVTVLGNPPQYAPLTGLNIDTKRFGGSVEKLKLDTEITADGTRCYLTGEVKVPFDGEAEWKCRILNEEGQQAAFVSQRLNFFQGVADFRMAVPLDQNGTYDVQMFLLDKQGLVFQQSKSFQLEISPLTIKNIWPVLHNVIFHSMTDKTVRLEVKCNLTQELLKECQLHVKAIHQENGSVVKEETISLATGIAEVVLPLENVSPGTVVISMELEESGKVMTACAKEMKVLPPLPGNECWIDSQRRVVVNGRPTFLLGFYGVVLSDYDTLRNCGCNMAQNYGVDNLPLEKVLETLDILHSKGLKIIIYPFSDFIVTSRGLIENGQIYAALSQEQKQRILNFVKAIKDHPALLGWYLFDEPHDDKFVNTLYEINQLIHEVDPGHITMGCHDSGNGCLEVKDCADVLFADIYPVPQYGDNVYGKPFASIFNQVRSVAQNTEGNGIVYAPQAFDWDSYVERPNNYRPLTFPEIRLSVFGNIIAGACSGIVPFKIGDCDLKYGEHSSNSGVYSAPCMKLGYLHGVIPEVAALEQVLLAQEAELPVLCDNESVKHLTKSVMGSDGKLHTYVFTANLFPRELGQICLQWPNDKPVRLLGEEMPIKQDGRKIVLPFDKYAVHILTDDPDFQLPTTVEAIQRAIDADTAKILQ